jgi:UDP-glucose 4-epimerase
MFLEENRPYDAIIHLAGKAHDLKRTSNDLEYNEANFELTKKLYNRSLASDAQTFIYVSSVKAFAYIVIGVVTEDAIANPITVYGKSK